MNPRDCWTESDRCNAESQTVEECGQRLKIILESQSNPQPNHHLLVHLSQYLNQISQQSHTSPRLLGQTFTKIFFKHYLRYRHGIHSFIHSFTGSEASLLDN
ncbi:hypothetical protein ATANTOWER_030673 [Ataeniobius toweri]|uniref:Uncharacterized protein n=1 Tax=Ataeniobius toweri TaxID=208326 RepID=A0ABU7C7B9_9TELE|nr:hypothetical protein [Ataeniobius toweri]